MPRVHICAWIVAGGSPGSEPLCDYAGSLEACVQVSVRVQISERVCKAWVTVGTVELRFWEASLSQ